jgi:YHS domain-containing protein
MPRNADMTVSSYVDFQLDGDTILELIAEYNQVTGMLRLCRMDCGAMQAEVGGGEIDEVYFECFKAEVEVDMRVQVRSEWVSRVTQTLEFSNKDEYDAFKANPAEYLKSEKEWDIIEEVDVGDIDDMEIRDITDITINE